MQSIVSFFTHPFFIIIGGLTTVSAIVGLAYTLYLIAKGVLPAWIRLGMGLSKRKIAIFAEGETYDNLKDILADSQIFQEKNIIKIYGQSIKKGKSISIILVHWKTCGKDLLDKVLEIKNDSDSLIVYAPQNEGRIDDDSLTKINDERNSIVVNYRGRLLNDVLVSMITTSYSREQ